MQSRRDRLDGQKLPVIDVCRSNVIKCVSCNHPCSDGFEVGNLVTNNFIEKSKGFLVERFIKPPVIVTFEFNCEVEIRFIVMFCKVGAQKSTGIELFSLSHSSNGQYESIASGILPDINNGFVFHRYSENVKDKFGEQFYFRTFKSYRCLSSIKSIIVKIFRTSGTSVPALGKIEIWGIPSKDILSNKPSIELKNTFSDKPTKSIQEREEKSKLIPESSRVPKYSTIGSTSNIPSTSIPDDFIDPITCEFITQPVILPSGKIVDIKTLELHQKAELQWGRGPSDPFTGIPFTDSNKPVAASDLKARIDKFLSDNSNNTELHKIPRTVGRSYPSTFSEHNASRASVSKLIVSSNISNKSAAGKLPVISKCVDQTLAKRRKVETENELISKNCSNSVEVSSPTRMNKSVGLCAKSRRPTTVHYGSLEERMEQSFELALKSTLSKLPKLTENKCSTVEKPLVNCSVCKSCDNLFSIPCSHFVCRRCLLNFKQKGSIICSLCNVTYNTGDVQKVHVGLS